MKSLKSLIPARLLIPIGMLVVVTPSLVNHFIAVPDFFRGLLMGAGIGLEIYGLILLRKNGSSTCKVIQQDTKL
ncbi:MAG: hypothetical protein JWP94_2482 [Mucilaginibacter sp.]|jgi:hypothetical protein|nr:hypothetical protein [Mucilaginibacter sp.]